MDILKYGQSGKPKKRVLTLHKECYLTWGGRKNEKIVVDSISSINVGTKADPVFQNNKKNQGADPDLCVTIHAPGRDLSIQASSKTARDDLVATLKSISETT